jgi:hypothetical protein
MSEFEFRRTGRLRQRGAAPAVAGGRWWALRRLWWAVKRVRAMKLLRSGRPGGPSDDQGTLGVDIDLGSIERRLLSKTARRARANSPEPSATPPTVRFGRSCVDGQAMVPSRRAALGLRAALGPQAEPGLQAVHAMRAVLARGLYRAWKPKPARKPHPPSPSHRRGNQIRQAGESRWWSRFGTAAAIEDRYRTDLASALAADAGYRSRSARVGGQERSTTRVRAMPWSRLSRARRCTSTSSHDRSGRCRSQVSRSGTYSTSTP